LDWILCSSFGSGFVHVLVRDVPVRTRGLVGGGATVVWWQLYRRSRIGGLCLFGFVGGVGVFCLLGRRMFGFVGL